MTVFIRDEEKNFFLEKEPFGFVIFLIILFTNQKIISLKVIILFLSKKNIPSPNYKNIFSVALCKSGTPSRYALLPVFLITPAPQYPLYLRYPSILRTNAVVDIQLYIISVLDIFLHMCEKSPAMYSVVPIALKISDFSNFFWKVGCLSRKWQN